MATVPTYQRRFQENLNAAPTVNVSTTPEAFGGGQSAAPLNNLVTQVNDAYQEYAKQADTIAATDADAKAQALTNRLIYDPRDGFMTKKGKDALAIPNEYLPKFQEEMDAIESTLNNDRQRALFRAQTGQYRTKMLADVNKYVAAEGVRYDAEVTESRVAIAKDDALMNFQDPGAVQNSIATQTGAIKAFAERTGKPPEWVEAEVRKNVSETHVGVIDRMININEPEVAKQYYATIRDELSGADQARLDKNLSAGMAKKQSMDVSDQIMGQGLGYEASLAAARKSSDNPEVRDETVRRVKERFAERETAIRTNQTLTVEKIQQAIGRGESIDNAVDVSVFTALPSSVQKNLREQEMHRKTGVSYVSDANLVSDLERIAAADPIAFQKIDLAGEYSARLNPEDLQYFSKIQGDQKGGNNNSTRELTSLNDAMNSAMIDFGLNPNATGERQKLEISKMRIRMKEAMNEQQQILGKKLNYEQQKSIAESLLIEQRKSGPGFFEALVSGEDFSFGGSNRRLYELDPEEIEAVNIDQIPRDLRRRIEADLVRAGRPVTDANIEAVAVERLRGLRGAQ